MIGLLNAGTHPEPMYLADALVQRGHEVTYFTSSSLTDDHAAARLARSRLLARTGLGRDIGRRVMPVLDRSAVAHAAVGLELLFQASTRLRPRWSAALLEARTRRFRAVSARRLARTTDLEAVIAQYTSGLRVFQSVPSDTVKVLIYPIAHHRWMRDRLREEAQSNPRWAPYLQGHANPPAFDRMLDEEIALADVVLVPSTFVKETFEYAGVDATIIPVPLGVDARVLDAPDAAVPAATGAPLRLLFAGQINQRKGISYLLDGFESAGLAGATLRLVGPHADGILPLIRAYEHVEILPSMPREQLAAEYTAADLLVLPSLAEGFGLVVIESMSRGTPALVTARTLAGDVITDGVDGLVVPAADAAAVSEGLRRIDRDRDALARMSAAAQATARRFSWRRFGDAAADAVEDAVRRASDQTRALRTDPSSSTEIA